MRLADALRVRPPTSAAFVGAGGKTSALFRLASELTQEHRRVFLSASTHLATAQTQRADHHFIIHDSSEIDRLAVNLPTGRLLFSCDLVEPERMGGLDAESLQRLWYLAQAQQSVLLIEADGARRRHLKAPAAHEPAVPAWVEQVIVVTGLQGLHRPLDDHAVHRPELFASLSGLQPGEPITPQALIRVLVHPQGGLKNIPPQARRSLMLNQVDDARLAAQAAGMGQALLQAYHQVVTTCLLEQPEIDFAAQFSPALACYEQAAGIILAAGAASRFGQPKQLLEIDGQPLVRRAALAALQAGLSPVRVVTGAYAEQVAASVSDLPVQPVHNPDWESGQSSSLQAGLRGLPEQIGSAVFLLADQPFVPAALLRSLIARHAETLGAVIAPLIDGQRGNPVLFDRGTFPDLLALKGDTGGRAIFWRYLVIWMPWHDPDVLIDVDTLADWQRLQERPS